MLTADPSDKKNTFKVAFLTSASIFVMGYLNALALNTYDTGAMITPQTGNVIWMGIFAASGYWWYFVQTLGLFFGFMGGAVFALYTQHLFKNKSTQFYWNWSFFAVPIMIYPILLMYTTPPWINFTVLGFSAGATLGFFRKMYHQEINTSMATGNVRFLGLFFAQALAKNSENKKEIKYMGEKKVKAENMEAKSFWIFFVAVFAFAFGAFLYVMLARVDAALLYDTGLNVRLTLGNVETFRTWYDGDGGTARLTLGMRGLRGEEYMYLYGNPLANTGNFARVVGLLVISIIPFFFCPRATKKVEEKVEA